MPNISIIVPVYKVEAYLRRCIESILNQTYRDFELILVDDGSPDNCGVICDEYASQYTFIHVIHQKNGGLSAARNAGLDWAFLRSSSGWLTFVDSDDWLHPEYLRIMYSAVESCHCAVSSCGIFRTSGDEIPSVSSLGIECCQADIYYCEKAAFPDIACGKLYQKMLFETVRFPVGKLHEDEFTTYRVIFQCNNIAVISAMLYAYFQNPDGITSSNWNIGRMHVLEAIEEQIRFAKLTNRLIFLRKVTEKYIYAAYDQLCVADEIYRGDLRRKLRRALKLGRDCGCFMLQKKNLWAYEQAYPIKPLWWLISKF